MTSLFFGDQLAALRSVVFGAINDWNSTHPHPLRSRHEHGSVSVTEVYSGASGTAGYSIIIVCSLTGPAQLAFHGPDLAALAERAGLTLERKIAMELKRRADKAGDHEFDQKYGIAV